MALNLGELNVLLTANSMPFNKELKGAENQIKSLEGGTVGFAKKAGPALLSIGIALGAAALGAIKMAAEFEQTQIAFETMLGSADDAKIILNQIYDLAAKTPFEFPELANAGKQLLAFGIEAGKIQDTLRMLGDVASGIGAPLGDMAYLFGTIKTQGRAMTMDLMQFANRGVPIFELVGKVMNVSTAEVRKLAEQGKIGFPEIEKAFQMMTSEGGKFYGMMEKQSKTVNGLMSTLKDNINFILRDFGEALLGGTNANKNLEIAIIWTEKLRESLIIVGSIWSLVFNNAKIALLNIIEIFVKWYNYISQAIPGANKLFSGMTDWIEKTKKGIKENIYTGWQNAVEKLNGTVGKLSSKTKEQIEMQKKLNEEFAITTHIYGDWMNYTGKFYSQFKNAGEEARKSFKGMGGEVERVNEKIDKLQTLLNFGKNIGGQAGEAIQEVAEFGQAWKTAGKAIKDMQDSIGKGFWAMLGPLGMIGGAVTKIADKIRNWFKSPRQKHLEALRKQYADFIGTVKEFKDNSIIKFGENAQNAFDLLTHMTKSTSDAMAEMAADFLEKFMAIASVIESGVNSGFRNAIKTFLEGGDLLTSLREGIKGAIMDGIIEAVMQGAIIKGALGGLLSQLTEGLAAGTDVTGIIGQIGAAIPTIAAQLEGILTPLRDALTGAFGNIPAMASGGVVTSPTIAQIGESGPEAVIPLNRMGGYSGGNGPTTIIIELDGRQIAKKTVEHMPSVLRFKGITV